MNLTDIILEYQNGNNDIILCILEKFKFSIKKFSKKLNYECAETDLNIYLIELIKKIEINKLKNKTDGAIVNYIYTSLSNKCSCLYKQNLKFYNETTEFNDNINSIETFLETDNIELYSLFECLNETQKLILVDKFLNKLTDTEIASKLGISRQSVYKNKIKGLDTLKKLFL
ncbi:MAG: sigma-70 family RNA polymerase sigma factor [Clostridium sp.]